MTRMQIQDTVVSSPALASQVAVLARASRIPSLWVGWCRLAARSPASGVAGSTGGQPGIWCPAGPLVRTGAITTAGSSSRWPAAQSARGLGLVKAAGSSSGVAERGVCAGPRGPDTR